MYALQVFGYFSGLRVNFDKTVAVVTISEPHAVMLASVAGISILSFAACFVGKVCGPLWSTWRAPLGEGKSGVKVGIVNAKVVRRANPPDVF